ncbi:hypothetical protein NM688_g5137 [Phlebia brevispora]|uniref:Uncharacterized protein n=1 Tax=Phlebia brevispora TaxID=194682 RepID=A0ACC1T0M7_9APHY|nr:hypothetical protein NM688_g5137 [Phlebia brevispora]
MSSYAHTSALKSAVGPSCTSFVLDGLGIPSSTSAHVIQMALEDAKAPLGGAVLLSCYEAFTQEFKSLTADEAAASGIDLRSLSTPESLLHTPNSLPVLRYTRNNPLASVPRSTEHGEREVGILAFSTGMFAGVVIACAKSVPTFICDAVEVFRTVFWLGFRVQAFIAKATKSPALCELPVNSWSLVTFGSTRSDIQDAVDRCNADQDSQDGAKLYLTAVTYATCISVSGQPSALATFKAHYLPASTTSARFAPIHALYHSPDLKAVKEEIMHDLARRAIHFLTHASLKRSLRSTITGGLISRQSGEGYTLVEEVLDMTLLKPVNFDNVLNAICEDISPSASGMVQLVNIGPGNALWKGVSRALPDVHFDMVDWSSGSRTGAVVSDPASSMITPVTRQSRDPIAIVGMAVRFPGAQDANALWDLLEKGLNTVSEIPASRFNVSEYTSGAHGANRWLKTRFGNFLEDPATFDNVFFQISPREARSMDPQQRLLLEVSYHALENAGYVPRATTSFDPETFATYVGVATQDYVHNLRDEVDVYYSTGTLQAFLSGKISYAHGFSGPSVVVDTACSSSMVAIYQACRSLTNGDCNAALAGGVNVITSPDMYIGLDRGHFLSPTGQCKPWDASADGYCRSEGCGMFVLKRLSDAWLKTTTSSASFAINLFRKLLYSAGVKPEQIGVVEAHGTGTKAGDPTELESIRSVLAKNRSQENPLHLTSIKANIGHAEAASGAASLAKLLLMLRHRTIPATIFAEAAQPRHSQSRGRRYDDRHQNHVLDEERPPRTQPVAAHIPGVPFIVGISCKTEAALENQRNAYVTHIEQNVHDAAALGDFAYSATARRQLYKYRLVGHGTTKDELLASLRSAKITEVRQDPGKVVFVFSGQGGQYLGMGAELYRSSPLFRKTVDRCHELLVSWGLPGILEIINAQDMSPEDSVQAFQSAVFVLECALTTMWISWGIEPDAVVGHSLGEYAALVTAGVLTLEDGLKLVAMRANFMVQKCALDETGMLAVRLGDGEIREIVSADEKYSSISVACYNSGGDTVLAGDILQLEFLRDQLAKRGNKCILIDVPFGYHSRAMDPILGDIASIASKVRVSPPVLPIVSNVLGRAVLPGDASVFTPEYFARHCAQPVQFEQGIRDLVSGEGFGTVSAWIEIGPHPTTLPMLRSTPVTSRQSVYLPSLRRNKGEWCTLGTSLAALYFMPTEPNWREVFRAFVPNAQLVDLPAYPFEKTRYWVEFREHELPENASPSHASTMTRFTLAQTCVSASKAGSGSPETAIFETTLAKLAPLIEGHQVSGHALCPASVYIEAASAATQLTMEQLGRIESDAALVLSDIAFHKPLVYVSAVSQVLRVEITLSSPSVKHLGTFCIKSYTADPSELQTHCVGAFDLPAKSAIGNKISWSSVTIAQRKSAMLEGNLREPPETFSSRTTYDVIFPRVVTYSPAYKVLKSITLDPNGVDVYGSMRFRHEVPGTFVVHPVFTDALLHAAGFAINCRVGAGEGFICNHVGKVRLLPDLVRPDADYEIYCSIGFLSESIAVADAFAFQSDGASLRAVAHIKGMRFSKLRLDRLQTALSAAAPQDAPSREAQDNLPRPLVVRHSLRTNDRRGASSPGVEEVKQLIADVLGIPSNRLSEDANLEELGMDSLTSIELWHALCSGFDVAIPREVLVACRTVEDVIAAIVPGSPSTMDTEETHLVRSGSESTLNGSDSMSETASQTLSLFSIKQIIASVLGVPVQDLGEDEDLEELGMDSLASIEVRHALRAELNIVLRDDVFGTCRTISQFQNLVRKLASPSPDVRPSAHLATSVHDKIPHIACDNPVKLQDGNGSAPPLFLIHDGSGLAHQYGRLSPLGCPVWGIYNPKFATAERWEGGLLEMATHYADLVKPVLSGKQTCLIGGWSVGGVIAFEVARQLISSSVRVAGLVLIDSPPPQTKAPLSSDVLATLFAHKSPSPIARLARTQIEFATEALVEYTPYLSPAKHTIPQKAVMLRCREPFSVGPCRTESDLFLSRRGDDATFVAEWEALLGYRIPTLDIPGNHFEPFDWQHIHEVSGCLKEAISIILEDGLVL